MVIHSALVSSVILHISNGSPYEMSLVTICTMRKSQCLILDESFEHRRTKCSGDGEGDWQQRYKDHTTIDNSTISSNQVNAAG